MAYGFVNLVVGGELPRRSLPEGGVGRHVWEGGGEDGEKGTRTGKKGQEVVVGVPTQKG